ncbi:MAG: hypothetical protein COA54_15465 [Thiotrichaceae bacterium]|nr:MAG: hypothetical protein COA54_15465 [Thiotrichaceae bacterium]
MTEINFNVYYKFDGPTLNKPLLEKKTKNEISESFDRIENELAIIINDPNAVITVKNSNTINLSIVSNLSEEDIAHAVKRTLDGLGFSYNVLP